MDLPIIFLLIVYVIFQFVFIDIDVSKNNNIKQEIFSSLRYANQNSLIEIDNEYKDYLLIDSVDMLEKWIINFCISSSRDIEKMKISFIQIESDPLPLYLVKVEGFDGKYVVISNDVYSSYMNGAMIIKENNEKRNK